MLPSDIRNLQEAYQNLYEESDLLTNDLIEEIVEELVEECLEFGYNLDDSFILLLIFLIVLILFLSWSLCKLCIRPESIVS